MGIEPCGTLGPEGGRLALTVEAQVDGTSFAGGPLLPFHLQVRGNPSFLQSVRIGRIHPDGSLHAA